MLSCLTINLCLNICIYLVYKKNKKADLFRTSYLVCQNMELETGQEE